MLNSFHITSSGWRLLTDKPYTDRFILVFLGLVLANGLYVYHGLWYYVLAAAVFSAGFFRVFQAAKKKNVYLTGYAAQVAIFLCFLPVNAFGLFPFFFGMLLTAALWYRQDYLVFPPGLLAAVFSFAAFVVQSRFFGWPLSDFSDVTLFYPVFFNDFTPAAPAFFEIPGLNILAVLTIFLFLPMEILSWGMVFAAFYLMTGFVDKSAVYAAAWLLLLHSPGRKIFHHYYISWATAFFTLLVSLSSWINIPIILLAGSFFIEAIALAFFSKFKRWLL